MSTHVEPWMREAAEQWYGVDCGKSHLVDGLVSVIAAHAPAVGELIEAAKEVCDVPALTQRWFAADKRLRAALEAVEKKQ